LELLDAYNQINALISETYEQTEQFYNSIRILENSSEEFKSIIIRVLYCFRQPNSQHGLLGTTYAINQYDFRKFGIEGIKFPSSIYLNEYRLLKETTKENLTCIINKYSPIKLEVQEIFIHEYDATVIVTLKDLII